MAHKISVGYYFDTDAKETMVGITLNNTVMGLSPGLARDIAVDLMLWADRLDPPKSTIKNQELTE